MSEINTDLPRSTDENAFPDLNSDDLVTVEDRKKGTSSSFSLESFVAHSKNRINTTAGRLDATKFVVQVVKKHSQKTEDGTVRILDLVPSSVFSECSFTT
ncbi:hypothetical protein IV203_036589 [Nitzschia inconspicua]|uniref:Uncharacterized protein n=1 Tax=Nitzschia inconspicua TaxID=303405 RepID=A0A9K3LH08_9STRA|nr:hypothetical protein IV203_036589 [Nitzschia inconspicua]